MAFLGFLPCGMLSCVKRYTALHYACLYGHEGVARLLVQRGADPFLRNREGNTSLDLLEVSELHDLRRDLEELSEYCAVYSEALFHARRFYRHLMIGSIDHHDPTMQGEKRRGEGERRREEERGNGEEERREHTPCSVVPG